MAAAPFNLAHVQQRLAQTPTALRQLTEHLSPDALAFREAPGTWSVLEVLCHLADGEVHDWMPRVRVILSSGADKRFTPFDRERGFVRYAGWPAAAVLDEFAARRTENLAAFEDLHLTPAELALEGVHPAFGAVTLEQLLATWITHDFAHVSQISRVLVRYFGNYVGPWREYFSLLNGR